MPHASAISLAVHFLLVVHAWGVRRCCAFNVDGPTVDDEEHGSNAAIGAVAPFNVKDPEVDDEEHGSNAAVGAAAPLIVETPEADGDEDGTNAGIV